MGASLLALAKSIYYDRHYHDHKKVISQFPMIMIILVIMLMS